MMMCFIFGTLGNFFSFLYFMQKVKKTPALIYTMITINDIVISVFMFPMALSYFSDRQPLLFSSDFFCNMWGVLWLVIFRLSVYFVVLMSVSRTLCMMFPFQKIRSSTIITVTVFYTVILLLQALVPFWYNHSFVFNQACVQCFSLLHEIFPVESVEFIIYYAVIILFEYCAPIIPTLLSCTFSIAILSRTRDNAEISKSSNVRQRFKREAAVTVVLFSILYIFCNIPLVLYELTGTVQLYKYKGEKVYYYWDGDGLYYRNFVAVMSVGLNSTANAMLYFYRMRMVRRYIIRCITSLGTIPPKVPGPNMTFRNTASTGDISDNL